MIVLDTSVVSLIFNGDTRGEYFKQQIDGQRCVISFQTLEELRFGVVNAGWGERRRNELEQHLGQYEVIWPNLELVDLSATLRFERKKIGRKIATADAWIAATALLLNCPLASHDRDFKDIPSLDLIRRPTP